MTGCCSAALSPENQTKVVCEILLIVQVEPVYYGKPSDHHMCALVKHCDFPAHNESITLYTVSTIYCMSVCPCTNLSIYYLLPINLSIS